LCCAAGSTDEHECWQEQSDASAAFRIWRCANQTRGRVRAGPPRTVSAQQRVHPRAGLTSNINERRSNDRAIARTREVERMKERRGEKRERGGEREERGERAGDEGQKPSKPPPPPPTTNDVHTQGDGKRRRQRRRRRRCCRHCRCHLAPNPSPAAAPSTRVPSPTKHPCDPPSPQPSLTTRTAVTAMTDNGDHVGGVVAVVAPPRPPRRTTAQPRSFAR
jgi:hypothetical protein